MERIESVYHVAVEHTKRKVYEDVERFFERHEHLPSFKEYIESRKHYLEQIWVNVWLNKVTNDIRRSEKKAFLFERGFEIEGVDRKLINHLFRNEMRAYEPFHVIEWVFEDIADNYELWETLYQQARENYFIKKEAELVAERKDEIKTEIDKAAQHLIQHEHESIYLYIRNEIANQLQKDFSNKKKYKEVDVLALEEKLIEIGSFEVTPFLKVGHFFEELTGEIHKTSHFGRTYFEYETYYFPYERLLNRYLYKLISRLVMDKLPAEVLNHYEQWFDGPLSESIVRKIMGNTFSTVRDYYMGSIQEEYIADLLHVADIPFDLDEHRQLYARDVANREKREAEELAEIERQREEEARMLEDIFGQEYNPGARPSIRYVLHIGDTNTGKTYHALQKMKQASSGLYLAPLRLLALEVFDRLNADGVPCSLKTGEEEKEILHAKHISSTVEMFHEKEHHDVIVIDEAQMITDKDRGFSWYKAITKANANEVHIIGSRNAKSMMMELLGDADIEINEYNRDTPLQVEKKEFKMKHVTKGDALICFSRKKVLETASRLQNSGHSVSMIYGSMPPETRKKQMQQFLKGETNVIVATDAIGMGLNLPIRRIVFLENEKFDGTERRLLTSQEVKQIAGRAGRKGIYEVGKVAFTSKIPKMKERLDQIDQPVHTFAIAPTSSVFERFGRYYRDLGTFFELWEKFEPPAGITKASLYEERELYEIIQDTEIEVRMNMTELYGFLHLPFSKKESPLVKQWYDTLLALMDGSDLPEPRIKTRSLEELELTYKAIGLHLLFLYRLERKTEAVYWERLREEISDQVHERLKTDVRKLTKTCKTCGKRLDWDHSFPICDSCFAKKFRKSDYKYKEKERRK
jgi:ATP-dependent RNA helicase SUPV3L1/SUV3